MSVLELINNHAELITFIFAIFAGLFAFIKWLDDRKQKLKNYRYERYIQNIRRLFGSRDNADARICISEQIAVAWLLLEYREYYSLTLKILDNPDLEKMSDELWQKFVLPQIKLVIDEIKSHS